jgi:hypothetical protein
MRCLVTRMYRVAVARPRCGSSPIAFFPLSSDDEEDYLAAAIEKAKAFRPACIRYGTQASASASALAIPMRRSGMYGRAAGIMLQRQMRLQAFRHFWELLRRRPSYFMANDWNACIFMLHLVETLLDGVRTYSNRFAAERLATVTAVFDDKDEALEKLATLMQEAPQQG